MKPFIQSKTMWVGLAIALLPWLQQLQTEPVLAQYPKILSAIGVLIIVLRAVTTKGISFGGGK